MKHPYARLACAALLVAAAVAPAAAQVPLTPRSLGMSGAYLGVARGNEALFHNPANLGLSGNPLWSMSFPQIGFGATLPPITTTSPRRAATSCWPPSPPRGRRRATTCARRWWPSPTATSPSA
jgi:hypothetical protein